MDQYATDQFDSLSTATPWSTELRDRAAGSHLARIAGTSFAVARENPVNAVLLGAAVIGAGFGLLRLGRSVAPRVMKAFDTARAQVHAWSAPRATITEVIGRLPPLKGPRAAPPPISNLEYHEPFTDEIVGANQGSD